MVYEIREVDAIAYDDGWVWNTSYYMGEMRTKAKNIKAAFLRWLRNYPNLDIQSGWFRINDDGEVLELVDKETDRPIFAAISRW